MIHLRSVRGFKDLLTDAYAKHKFVVDTAAFISEKYGFSQISLPILEYEEVFTSSLGKDSDIINKEVYSFLDKSDNKLVLRPEFTAGIWRAIVSNGLQEKLPLRLFTHGPLFRYDRPQLGRQRQFSQVNFEHIGSFDAFSDAQMIKMSFEMLKDLKIADKIRLQINSLGCENSLMRYQRVLQEYFLKYESDLSADSKKRLILNKPLRILDSKDLVDKGISTCAPKIVSSYTKDALKYFDNLKQYLDYFSVPYEISEHLVRGLDYYMHTVFEFTTNNIGAQSTVLGGGRYCMKNRKFKNDIGSVGCAAGIERLVLLLDDDKLELGNKALIVIIPLSTENNEDAYQVFNHIISVPNISVVVESYGNLKKKMKNANSIGASYAVFVGDEEVKSRVYSIKNLSTGNQQKCSFENLYAFF